MEYSFDWFVEQGFCNEEVINVLCSINGTNETTFSDLLFYYTGYHDIEQYKEEIQE